jgi:hypothetical protein
MDYVETLKAGTTDDLSNYDHIPTLVEEYYIKLNAAAPALATDG